MAVELTAGGVGAVKGDDIACARNAAANRIVVPALDIHTAQSVAQIGTAVHICADVIALNDVPWACTRGNTNSVLAAGGNDIARGRAGPADGVAARRDYDYAIAGVAHSGSAGGISADEVSLHQISARRADSEPHPGEFVARNYIAGPGAGPADCIV